MENALIAEDSGRLDTFLASKFPDRSRNRLKTRILDGDVLVNDEVVTKPSFALQSGDRITLEESEDGVSADFSIESHDLDLEILYEDDACFVVNMPAGIAVHPAPGEQGSSTLLNGIAFLFEKRGLPFSADSVLVHRLDKETTGCILVAKNEKAHLHLQKQFEERSVSKMYLALVVGVPKHETAMIDSPIGRDLHNRTKMSVMKTGKTREAKTTYRVVGSSDEVSLLECDLHTGRTHQIRVHLSSIGHPILGDQTYNTSDSVRVTKELAIEGMCLHAWKLIFVSPADNEKHEVTASLPREFHTVLERLGLHDTL